MAQRIGSLFESLAQIGLLSVVVALFFWGVEVYRQANEPDLWFEALTDISAALSHL